MGKEKLSSLTNNQNIIPLQDLTRYTEFELHQKSLKKTKKKKLSLNS